MIIYLHISFQVLDTLMILIKCYFTRTYIRILNYTATNPEIYQSTYICGFVYRHMYRLKAVHVYVNIVNSMYIFAQIHQYMYCAMNLS